MKDLQIMCSSLLQDGTPEDDVMRTAAMTAGGSLFLAGSTGGNWSSNSAGSEDFAVVQLHPNGTVLWRWQVMCFSGLRNMAKGSRGRP